MREYERPEEKKMVEIEDLEGEGPALISSEAISEGAVVLITSQEEEEKGGE